MQRRAANARVNERPVDFGEVKVWQLFISLCAVRPDRVELDTCSARTTVVFTQINTSQADSDTARFSCMPFESARCSPPVPQTKRSSWCRLVHCMVSLHDHSSDNLAYHCAIRKGFAVKLDRPTFLCFVPATLSLVPQAF